jgi:hypothetical protein
MSAAVKHWFLGLLLVGAQAGATTNQLQDFSIQQCHGAVCATAHGARAFVNYNGRLLYASRVTLDVRSHGRTTSHECDSFTADLASGRYVCDNRDGRGASLTIDADVRMKKY